MVKHKNKKQTIRLIAMLAVSVLLAGVSVFAYQKLRSNKPNNLNLDDSINYTPTTDEEKSETERHKDDIIKQDENKKDDNNTAPDEAQAINVVISSILQNTESQAVEARGYADTFDESGTCVLTLTKGTSTVSVKGDAVQNVSTMSCSKLSVTRSKLSAGSWKATLSYQSTTAKGSVSQNIEVK